MSLLTRALQMPPGRKNNAENVADDMLELAIAYARHEVTQEQAGKVMGIKGSAAATRMRSAILSGIRSGKLVPAK